MMKKGFTLIELLVVIAILGVLAGVVLSSLNSARVSSRDARRHLDIHQINNALELYYDDYQYYPDGNGPTGPIKSNDATGWSQFGSWIAPYIPIVPVDPLNDSSHAYIYESSDIFNSNYTLSANYEKTVAPATSPSVVEFLHKYIADKDPTGYTFTAPAQIGDVVLIAIQGQFLDSTHSTVRDSLGNTYTERIDARASVWSEITILSTVVTNPGVLTLYLTSNNNDVGFSAYLLRGYPSDVPDAIAFTKDVTTTPSTVPLTLTQQSTVFVFYGNEQVSTFTSWTDGLTLSNVDVGHVDAAGYQMGVPPGYIEPGYNVTGTSVRSVLVGVALPEST